MAERALVFGIRKKWEYFGLKVKKIETDFTAVLVYVSELCVYICMPEGCFASLGDEKEISK